MDEKTVVVGNISKKISMVLLIIGIICFAMGVILYAANFMGCRHTYIEFLDKTFRYSFGDLLSFGLTSNRLVTMILYAGIALIIIGILFYIAVAKVSITVTNKRVYGTATWGRRVDLPLDSISTVATSALNGIAVATSSGAIKFLCIENYEIIRNKISELLIERQQKEKNVIVVEKDVVENGGSAEELKKYKALLDEEVITKEEFERKKRQLLNL